jgi:malonyl-CoA O-methyltransferase
MDAARPALAPGFDVVCSSLTLQWMANADAVLEGWRSLLRPGGRLAVATLLDGSYGEWRAALAEAGAPPSGPAFPALDEARGWFGPDTAVQTVTLGERHASGLAFLRAMGASGTDAAETRTQAAGTMRRAMRAFEAGGGNITYEVLIAVETL